MGRKLKAELSANGEDLSARVGRTLATDRWQYPTASFVDLYNRVREKLAPNWPQVSHEKYVPEPVMDAVLAELEVIAHPPTPAAPPQTLEGAIEAACKRWCESTVASLVAEALAARESAIKGLVEDTVLALLANREISPAPVAHPSSPIPSVGVDNTPVPASPPSPPHLRRMKVAIVDPRAHHWAPQIEKEVPDFVQVVFEPADKSPPSTVGRRDYVLVCHRSSEFWIRAFQAAGHGQKTLLRIEHPTAETYTQTIRTLAVTFEANPDNYDK